MTTCSISSRLAPAILLSVIAFSTVPLSAQALPPERVNYQGVLRDQNNLPLSGTFDMWFRFFDAASVGNEILVDQHAAATGNAITVSGGLLDVVLGTGTVTDGSGPGTYTQLSTVFRDYTDVWLEIQVGAETLSPRTQVQSVPYAMNSRRLSGHAPSFFLDTSSSFQSKAGRLWLSTADPGNPALSVDNNISGTTGTAVIARGGDMGLWALGNSLGGWFIGGTGVSGQGNTTGGTFSSDAAIGQVELATATAGVDSDVDADFGGFFFTSKPASTGVAGKGDRYGATFSTFNTADSTGVLTTGYTYGIDALGYTAGGHFRGPTAATVDLAVGNYGLLANGGTNAGKFQTTLPGSTGIWSSGVFSGGYFTNSSTGGAAYLGVNGVGIQGSGPAAGAYFLSNDYASHAYIPLTDRGIYAHGSGAGGAFDNGTTGAWALVSYSSYKIFGSGAVSFVQNHPEDPSKAIVYAAPEGDEVAVYTRGSGRLVNGEARVKLGDTFRWVANPDIGLTAHLTPVGGWADLYIASRSTEELVVRSRDPRAADVEFDYIVYGLRIGFEEQSIVQPKQDDSKIPSMHQHAKYFEDDPSLRRYTALTRFEGVEEAVHGRKPTDFSQANALRNAIGVNPPNATPAKEPNRSRAEPQVSPDDETRIPAGAPGVADRQPAPVETASDSLPADRSGTPTQSSAPAGLDIFSPVGAIEVGDVVSLSPNSPGAVARTDGLADALVIGCAQIAVAGSDQVTVATGRIALCRVSAAWGSVAVGDRLSPSPLGGTAMNADAGQAGTFILGRAIEPLDSGTALVRVLLGVK